jgi:hypothetical protein
MKMQKRRKEEKKKIIITSYFSLFFLISAEITINDSNLFKVFFSGLA